MAVILCREDGKGYPFSPDLRNAPSVVIRNEPVPTPSHQGKKISARSGEIYACAEPGREEVWRDAFERRKVQLSSCGFHGPAHKPYRDMGPVVLEDSRLILEGLGQGDHEQQGGVPSPEPPLPPPSLPHTTPPARIQLRERMPSQFPTELAELAGEMREGHDRLEMVRKGHGLFQIMRDAEKEKQSEAERAAQLERGAKCNEWKEAVITSHTSLHDNGTVLSRQPTAPDSTCTHSTSSNRRDLTSDHGATGNGHTPHTAEWSLEGKEDGGEKGEETPQVADVVYPCYRQLCVLVWILRAMQMESPSHMTPLSQCWRVEWTPPTAHLGKKLCDRNRAVMSRWDRLVTEHKTPILQKRWKSAMRTFSRAAVFSRMASVSPDHKATPSRDHMTSPDTPGSSPIRNSTSPEIKKKQKTGGDRVREVLRQRAVALATAQEEEERMKKQRRLTPAQLQQLRTTVEEELNYSKKMSRSRIDALVRQADKARMQSDPAHIPPRASSLPAISLDMGSVKRRFSEAEERRKMIVHEQLTAMERDRQKALQQRISSLQVSGNLWQDLQVMRRGVQIESTAMARRRLLMNYEWFPELLSRLPPEVHRDRYCQQLLASLEELSRVMAGVGPARMSKRRLIAVLGTLRPWELRSPEISTAVEFLITRVIYIVQEDYESWLQHHSLTHKARATPTPART